MSKKYIVTPFAQPSRNTCWHAASIMIWNYWQGVTNRQGPMNTLAGNYTNDKAITPQEFIVLAGKAGLQKEHNFNRYTSAVLERLLIKRGPLWCAGYWYGVRHIIVLTGIDGVNIYFNDPDGGLKKMNTVNWFDNHISKQVNGCIMYKDPQAY